MASTSSLGELRRSSNGDDDAMTKCIRTRSPSSAIASTCRLKAMISASAPTSSISSRRPQQQRLAQFDDTTGKAEIANQRRAARRTIRTRCRRNTAADTARIGHAGNSRSFMERTPARGSSIWSAVKRPFGEASLASPSLRRRARSRHDEATVRMSRVHYRASPQRRPPSVCRRRHEHEAALVLMEHA